MIEAIENFLTDPAPRFVGKYGPDDLRVLEYLHAKLTDSTTDDTELSTLRQLAKMRLSAYGIEV